MRTYKAMTQRPGRKKAAGGILALLGLVGTGLPNGRAQLEYNGGFVQTHREDRGDIPSLAAPPHGARSPTNTPPSYAPDSDFYYPPYDRATTSVTHSYYAGRESGRLVAPPASRMPFDISATALPWNQVGFKDYDEPPETPRDSLLFSPRKYFLEASPLPQRPPAGRPVTAVLVAHLPEHAMLWVEGIRTRSTGRTRYFHSPPLQPGRKYSYTVRAAWIEDGHWVSQTRKVPVQAGLIQAVYLRSRYGSSQYETRRSP